VDCRVKKSILPSSLCSFYGAWFAMSLECDTALINGLIDSNIIGNFITVTQESIQRSPGSMDSFWAEVTKAYEQVYSNPEQEATVELNGKRAVVQCHVRWNGGVMISITDVPVEKPTLIAP
jgi:hypothetical protein